MTNILFKYQLINEASQPTGWLSKKGSFDGERIQLDGESFPAATIYHTTLVNKVFVFVVAGTESAARVVSMLVHSGNVKELKTEIDRLRSAAQVTLAEQTWQSQGH